MPCIPLKGGGFICTGNRGVAPPGYHFGWDDDMYPVITNGPDSIITCQDCGDPAIICSFWAYCLDMAYCENCAWVHRDILPKARRKRQDGEMLEDDKYEEVDE